jgi:hypothetical protein
MKHERTSGHRMQAATGEHWLEHVSDAVQHAQCARPDLSAASNFYAGCSVPRSGVPRKICSTEAEDQTRRTTSKLEQLRSTARHGNTTCATSVCDEQRAAHRIPSTSQS